MITIPDKQARYLWQPMQPAHTLAQELRLAAENKSENLPDLIEQAALRLIEQENQIGGFINLQLSRMSPQKAAIEMAKAGISRNEMVACWHVPMEMAVEAEVTKQKDLLAASQRGRD